MSPAMKASVILCLALVASSALSLPATERGVGDEEASTTSTSTSTSTSTARSRGEERDLDSLSKTTPKSIQDQKSKDKTSNLGEKQQPLKQRDHEPSEIKDEKQTSIRDESVSKKQLGQQEKKPQGEKQGQGLEDRQKDQKKPEQQQKKPLDQDIPPEELSKTSQQQGLDEKTLKEVHGVQDSQQQGQPDQAKTEGQGQGQRQGQEQGQQFGQISVVEVKRIPTRPYFLPSYKPKRPSFAPMGTTGGLAPFYNWRRYFKKDLSDELEDLYGIPSDSSEEYLLGYRRPWAYPWSHQSSVPATYGSLSGVSSYPSSTSSNLGLNWPHSSNVDLGSSWPSSFTSNVGDLNDPYCCITKRDTQKIADASLKESSGKDELNPPISQKLKDSKLDLTTRGSDAGDKEKKDQPSGKLSLERASSGSTRREDLTDDKVQEGRNSKKPDMENVDKKSETENVDEKKSETENVDKKKQETQDIDRKDGRSESIDTSGAADGSRDGVVVLRESILTVSAFEPSFISDPFEEESPLVVPVFILPIPATGSGDEQGQGQGEQQQEQQGQQGQGEGQQEQEQDGQQQRQGDRSVRDTQKQQQQQEEEEQTEDVETTGGEEGTPQGPKSEQLRRKHKKQHQQGPSPFRQTNPYEAMVNFQFGEDKGELKLKLPQGKGEYEFHDGRGRVRTASYNVDEQGNFKLTGSKETRERPSNQRKLALSSGGDFNVVLKLDSMQ